MDNGETLQRVTCNPKEALWLIPQVEVDDEGVTECYNARCFTYLNVKVTI